MSPKIGGSAFPRSMPPRGWSSIPCFWSHVRTIYSHTGALLDEDAENLSGGRVEEERRLFYVACTRAERNLHISYAATRQNKPSGISPFLMELSGEHLNRLD